MTDKASEPDPRLRKAYAEAPRELLESQEKAIRLVLTGIDLALKRAVVAAEALDYNDRPNQTYLIDGGRGAGKTFTMLTLQRAINGLMVGGDMNEKERERWTGDWKDHAKLVSAPPSGFRAEVLRIIFPGEFTEGEMLMEHVFAEILNRLTHAEERYRDVNSGMRDLAKQKRASELKERLLKRVAQGWYFAKRFGFDAVVRDAINYEDLVSNWSEESSRAARRIDEWRSFVRDWLEFSDADLLVILLDDSDNDEILTENILHSMRLVLDHPQIVTVVAGNLNAMRDTLLHIRMGRLAHSVGALRSGDAPSAKVWRRKVRREIEEYLEKVIPQQQRIYLTVARPGATKRASANFKTIVKKTLKALVREALDDTRRAFLDAKFLCALRHEAQESDAPDYGQGRNLEAYLSWWLFGNLYAAELQPRSARNLHTFRDHFGEQVGDKERWQKRLPVVLYGFSSNYDLLQQLTDDDSSVIAWLRQQSLGSIWTGRRALIVNDRELPHLAYGNAFLRYRLDVGLGMPFRDNAEQMVPNELLPEPVGRRNLRRFFQPRQSPRRHRRLGLARWLDHAAIPSNCLYFHDLMALPDGAFIDLGDREDQEGRAEIRKQQRGHWESRLADDWLSTVEDDQETDADEFLARYFREVVCEALRDTRSTDSGDLLNLIDPPDIREKEERAVYEHFVKDELSFFDLDYEHRVDTLKRGAGRDFPGPKNPERMKALYVSLASDLRRGWHAIRIHQVAPAELGDLEGDDSREVHAIVSTKDRLRLYKCSSIRAELERNRWLKEVLEHLGKDKLGKLFTDYFEHRETLGVKTRRSFNFLESFIDRVIEKINGAIGDDDTRRYLVSMALKAFLHSRLDFQLPPRLAALWEDVESDTGIDAMLDETGADPWIGAITDLRQTLRRIAADPDDDKYKVIAIAQARFRLYLREIDISRLFEARDRLYQRPLVQEENYSFDVWMRTLRSMARFLSEDWPFHDNVLSPVAHPKSFEVPPILTIRIPPPDDELSVKVDPENSDLRENGRSARNFVLLMYGLAPCLPAIIHANVMSRVYEAKQRLASVLRRDQPHQSPEGRRFAVAEGLGLIREAIEEIDHWAHLIGQLSVLLRVIKIKALHLDLRLLLEAFYKATANEKQGAVSDKDKAAIEEYYKLFKRAVERSHRVSEVLSDFPEEDLGRKMFDTFKEMMDIPEPLDAKGWHLITGLAIFPDISPSTLFGEGWIGDLVSRRAFIDRLREKCGREDGNDNMHNDNMDRDEEVFLTDRSNPDRPISESTLSITGVFGETEQWLWACNRTLRKLRTVIVDSAIKPRREDVDEDFYAELLEFLEEPRFTENGEERPSDISSQKRRAARLVDLANRLIATGDWLADPPRASG